MKFTDEDLRRYDDAVLRIAQPKRKEYLDQVDRLIARLEKRIAEDGSFSVRTFRKAGSLKKGTVLRPLPGSAVDADVAVYLDQEDADFDLDRLRALLRTLVRLVYPGKVDGDFTVNDKTLGITFRDSGLDVDLVPVICDDARGDGWGHQPSASGGQVLTCIPGQLDFIAERKKRDARYRRVVRIAKRWRDWQELDELRSFPIELWVAYLLDAEGPCSSVEDGLVRLFRWIAQSDLTQPVFFADSGQTTPSVGDPVVTLDPVNADNNVTARITEGERTAIVAAATEAFETLAYARRVRSPEDTNALWVELVGPSFTIEEAP